MYWASSAFSVAEMKQRVGFVSGQTQIWRVGPSNQLLN